MLKEYSYNDYDKYLCLKAGFGLWLVVSFLLRPYILLVSSFRMGPGGSGLKGVGGLKDLVYPDDLSLILGILATIPVLIFLYAWIRREPGAPDLVRKAWRHGKLLLVASVLLGMVAVFVPVWTGFVHKIQAAGWSQVSLSVIAVWYLQFSDRVNDTFRDFPEAKA
jgi:hypothetical protein